MIYHPQLYNFYNLFLAIIGRIYGHNVAAMLILDENSPSGFSEGL